MTNEDEIEFEIGMITYCLILEGHSYEEASALAIKEYKEAV